jgi:hypothetical protein
MANEKEVLIDVSQTVLVLFLRPLTLFFKIFILI